MIIMIGDGTTFEDINNICIFLGGLFEEDVGHEFVDHEFNSCLQAEDVF